MQLRKKDICLDVIRDGGYRIIQYEKNLVKLNMQNMIAVF